MFEHSPGRRDPRFTGDRSAFDVSVRYESPSGQRDFLGIEVKHHETLNDKASEHRSRYDEIADVMGCFPAERGTLRTTPLQQFWRGHLLSGALVGGGLGYVEGAVARCLREVARLGLLGERARILGCTTRSRPPLICPGGWGRRIELVSRTNAPLRCMFTARRSE